MREPFVGRIVRHHLTGQVAEVKAATNRGLVAYLLHCKLSNGLPVEWPSEEVEVIGPVEARQMIRPIGGIGTVIPVTRPGAVPALRPEFPFGGGSAA